MRTLCTPEPVGQVSEKIRRGNVALEGGTIGELRHKCELVGGVVNAQNILPVGFTRRAKGIFRGLAAQVVALNRSVLSISGQCARSHALVASSAFIPRVLLQSVRHPG